MSLFITSKAKGRQEAHGNVSTLRSLIEFRNQYIDGVTDSTATQVSGTTEDEVTQTSTVKTTACTTPTNAIPHN